jgi:hypothetical protein
MTFQPTHSARTSGVSYNSRRIPSTSVPDQASYEREQISREIEQERQAIPRTYLLPTHQVVGPSRTSRVKKTGYGAADFLKKSDLVIPDKTVEKIMGPEPIPRLDIAIDEIQNELQRKMVEEITCMRCGHFPYSPMECRKCNKLYCKNCQLELRMAAGNITHISNVAIESDPHEEQQKLNQMTPNARQSYLAAKQRQQNMALAPTPGEGCPNCGERGDFLQEVNKVLREIIDFCEFPHICYVDGKNPQVIWKTLLELQEHAIYDCPKFGCDICYGEEF